MNNFKSCNFIIEDSKMITQIPTKWDLETDVVVLGSGGAGLVATILAADNDAKTVLLEKAPLLGGTTGVSGGMPWIPLNDHMADLEVEDSREEALTYLKRLTCGKVPDPHLLEVYVDTAAEALRYLEAHTPLKMLAPKNFSDYYGDKEGGKRQGRSVEPHIYKTSEKLDEWADKLRTSPYMPPLTIEEGAIAGMVGDPTEIIELIQKRTKAGDRAMGAAMVAALFEAVLERGTEIVLECPGKELIVENINNKTTKVVGVRAEKNGADFFVKAEKAVILATGGYEWNKELQQAFLSTQLEPLSPPGNDGDGLIMAMEVGASLANMNSAWWYPSMRDTSMTYDGEPLFHFGSGRNLAGSIVVNRHGKRFVNEGTTYQDMPKSMHIYDQVNVEYPNEGPNWMIFDSKVKDKTMIVNAMPKTPAPDWMPTADTIKELAKKIDLPFETLNETIEKFNAHARKGEDPEFHRGTVYWENAMGGGANPKINLGPIEDAPFYAARIYQGTLGTNGGPRINENAQVLDHKGAPITGLYAAGNVAAGVFGHAYPGGGATIGPAIAFGYLAGKHAATE